MIGFRTVRARVALAAMALVLLTSAPGMAWNASGHMQIALLAYEKLKPSAQQALVQLLRQHPRFQQDFQGQMPEGLNASEQAMWIFAHAATWPDIARSQSEFHHGSWHYINRQLKLTSPTQTTECKATRVNKAAKKGQRLHLPAALSNSWQELRTGAKPSERALALSWFLHLVGDVHQPLHSVALHAPGPLRKGDRGGNRIEIARGGNLHQLWDEALGDSKQLSELLQHVARLRGEKVHDNKAVQGSFDDLVDGWVLESCQLARESVYTQEILRQALAKRRKFDLESDYRHLARLASRKRAALAANRMAALLTLAAQSL